jgi:CrcB protein
VVAGRDAWWRAVTGLALVLAGGLGALVRAVLGSRLAARGNPRAGTVAANVVGAAALGVLTGLAAGGHLDEATLRIAGAGFCGGLTTFSTWMMEAVGLAGTRASERTSGDGNTTPAPAGTPRPWRGAAHVGGLLILGVAAAALGRAVSAIM